MKLIEAINKLDFLLHNTYTHAEKVEWLSNVDSDVKKHIIDTHEGAESVSFSGYDDDTDHHTELLIPAPYDVVYLRWLEAQIHYHNGEYDKYNNAIVLYNTSFAAFEAYYNRTHKPVGQGRRFLF